MSEPLDFQEEMRRAQAGDFSAIQTLLGYYSHALRSFISRRLGDSLRPVDSTNDVVQSVAKELLRDWNKWTQDERSLNEKAFKQYLLIIAFRRVASRVRRAKVAVSQHELDTGAVCDPSSLEQAEDRYAAAVYQEGPQLFGEDWDLVWRKANGSTLVQIGKEMGLSEDQVSRRYRKALQRARHRLEREVS